MESIFLEESKGIEFNIKGKMATKEGQITIKPSNLGVIYICFTLGA